MCVFVPTDVMCYVSLLVGFMDINYSGLTIPGLLNPCLTVCFILFDRRKAFEVFMAIEIFAEVVSVSFSKDIIQWKGTCRADKREHLQRIRYVHILVN